jgi:hypothetical protein
MANYFNNILNPFGGIDIASFYLRYFSFIDAIIYLILFLSLAQLVFTKVYKDNKKEAKMVAVAISLALTVSMIVLEMRTSFYIGQLAPVALIVFLLVLAVLLYNLMLGLFTGTNGKMVSASLTYLIIYGLLIVPFGTLYKWIQTNASMLSAVLALASISAFIYLIIEMFSILGLGGKDDKGKDLGGVKKNPEEKPEEKLENKKLENKKLGEEPEEEKPLDPNVGTLGTFLGENIKSDVKTYSDTGRAIIELHRGIGGRAITAVDWENFYKAETRLCNDIKAFNNFANKLFTDAQYKKLTKKDLTELNSILKELTELDTKVLKFRAEMVNAYNNDAAQVPGRILD